MKKKNNFSFFSLIGKLMPYFQKYKKLLVLYAFFSLVCIYTTLTTANIINIAVESSIAAEKSKLVNYLVSMAVVVVLEVIASYLSTYFIGQFKAKVLKDLRYDAVKHIQKLPVAFMEDHHSGDLISRFTNDMSSLQNFISNDLFPIFFQTVIVIISSVYLISINWKLYLFSVLVIPPSLFCINIISKPVSLGHL